MKNVLTLGLICCLILLVSCSADDGSDLPPAAPFVGDVILESQAEVNEFVSNNHFGITGTLRITAPTLSGPSDITDLSGFSALEFVNGDLDIFSNSITSLQGLENLEAVGGSMSISFNNQLVEVNALSGLTSIGGNFSISSSENLTSINGFSGLTTIPGNLSIGADIGPGALSLPNLPNLNGLSNLVSVGGSFSVAGTGVTNLEGLERLTEIGENATISFNEALSNTNGMNSVASIGRSLVVSNNPNLLQINALSSVQEVGENVEIASHEKLNSINGLSGLRTVTGFIAVFANPSLISLGDGFENLETVDGVNFSENGIEDFSGFGNLVSCDYISLGNDENLVSISGFEALQDVRLVSITNAESLQNIDGFSSIETLGELTIEQPLTIIDGPIAISAFTNVVTVQTRVNIIGLANENINFLSSLANVGNSLNVYDNENLRDLCGLNTLVFNGGPDLSYNVFRNLYNPSQQDILNGNCSL